MRNTIGPARAQKGLTVMLESYRSELLVAMALTGSRSLDQLTAEILDRELPR